MNIVETRAAEKEKKKQVGVEARCSVSHLNSSRKRITACERHLLQNLDKDHN